MQLELPMQLHLSVEEEGGAEPNIRLRRSDAMAMALGPALLGASLVASHGWLRVLSEALVAPLVIPGVWVAMAPPLYVAHALGERALPLHTAVGAAVRALAESGRTALGLAPLVLLLTIGSPWPQAVVPVALGCFALAMAVGYLALYRALFVRHGRLAGWLFAGWALVGVGLALRILGVGA